MVTGISALVATDTIHNLASFLKLLTDRVIPTFSLVECLASQLASVANYIFTLTYRVSITDCSCLEQTMRSSFLQLIIARQVASYSTAILTQNWNYLSTQVVRQTTQNDVSPSFYVSICRRTYRVSQKCKIDTSFDVSNQFFLNWLFF